MVLDDSIRLWGLYKVNERNGLSVMFRRGLQEPCFKTFLKFKHQVLKKGFFVLFWTFQLEIISGEFKTLIVKYLSLKLVYF